jgi:NADPH:quinone reductase-like Zn-dependent oxidoreductase
VKAITFAEFGGPEVLRWSDVPEPVAGPGKVRVRVLAAGVNPIDYKIRRGWMEQAFPTRLPSIPGSELAGIVDQIGTGVTDLALGDEVFGWADSGAYAQYAVAEKVGRKPAEMPWAIAVALPIAGETAGRVLDLLGVKAGETLIVHGAAGSVGSIAVQLAVARGATVVGTASPANQDYVRGLGAIPVTYGDGLAERVRAVAPAGVDAAFDAAGRGALEPSIALLGGPERVITIADPEAAKYGVRFSSGGPADRSTQTLAKLVRAYLDGALRITIAQMFPLSAAAQAQALSEGGHARGKIVLTLD